MTRILLALMLAFGLGGCWISDAQLLDPAQAAYPLPDGEYQAVEGSDAGLLSRAADGGYEVRAKGGKGWEAPTRVLLVPLGTVHGRQVYASGYLDPDAHSYIYGLVEVDGGQVLQAAPYCGEDKDRELAESWGAWRKDKSSSDCLFKDAGNLKQALLAFAEHAEFKPAWRRR